MMNISVLSNLYQHFTAAPKCIALCFNLLKQQDKIAFCQLRK